MLKKYLILGFILIILKHGFRRNKRDSKEDIH